MSTYRTESGDETVVCDSCGVDYSGAKPDLSKLTKIDFTAEMMGLGFPHGTALSVTDTCPDCEKIMAGGKPAPASE